MRGLIHVCRKENALHRRRTDFAFRRLEKGRADLVRELRGVKGGELKVGVGSRVEKAEAPVSPRGSAPRPLDFRRGRGIFL